MTQRGFSLPYCDSVLLSPQSKSVSVAAQVFPAFHVGKSDVWNGMSNTLFSAENADECNNALQSFPVPEIAEGI